MYACFSENGSLPTSLTGSKIHKIHALGGSNYAGIRASI